MDANLRDVLTIGLPTASILLAFVFQNRRFERIEDKIDASEKRTDAKIDALEERMDAKIDALEARMDASINALDGKVNSLETKMNARFERIETALEVIQGDLRQFYHLTGELKGRLDTLEKRD